MKISKNISIGMEKKVFKKVKTNKIYIRYLKDKK